MYGKLLLGTCKNKAFDFILDFNEGGHPVLYFDGNQNRDLTDDGPPLSNRGTGVFGTVIKVPFHKLVKEVDWKHDFKIWFYTNRGLWPKKITRHYSLTQLKGKVTLDGKDYPAYIAERGANDADFTNDGIYIDINRNGKIETDAEHIGHGRVGLIEGKPYRFHIVW